MPITGLNPLSGDEGGHLSHSHQRVKSPGGDAGQTSELAGVRARSIVQMHARTDPRRLICSSSRLRTTQSN